MCPNRRKRQPEAAGRSTSEVSRMSCVEAEEKNELTEEELEVPLAKCRLQKEQRMLTYSTKEEVACIQMTQQHDTNPAVGPSLYLDLDIEGVPVVSMVDCGSPSTIISRSRTVQQMKSDGKPLPELSLPSVQLFGKDGRHEIKITAQVDLILQAGGKTVTIQVFVQPNRSQDCLLGTSACIPLGLQFLDGKGKPLQACLGLKSDTGSVGQEMKSLVSHVLLIQASTIPSRKCKLLSATVSGEQFVFESQGSKLLSLGLSSLDSLVTLHEGGKIFIPVQTLRPTELSYHVVWSWELLHRLVSMTPERMRVTPHVREWLLMDQGTQSVNVPLSCYHYLT